ncbi:ROK family transcriptional regulator [Desulfosporosinus sp. FKA]|uniref:ROK family transcriptional regulator n=1 Tax=Desulfosporosinus sp. FKA TaxID=1969834 RepID=UPI000B49CBAE|nr:ROK family transcriptional regulator [Desulfosporosinus sp. FKA]
MNKIIVTGNTKIREDHKRIILNFIRKHKTVSRTDIYKMTHISKPTVTRIIEDLLASKVIRESGLGDAGIGRRPVNLELNASAYYAIGVNISKRALNIHMVDLSMNVVGRKTVSLNFICNNEQFIETLIKAIKELINESRIDFNRILGIGVGARGMVNYQKGIIVDFSPSRTLHNITIKEHLENEFKLKVFLDNNAHTRVLGEYWYGYGIGYKDVVYIICNEGIGCGVITEGRIVRGKNNATQGLGHMKVDINGRQCSCGSFGCIESQCSTEAIEEIAKEGLRRGRKSILTERVDRDYESLNYKIICQCAEEGDLFSLQLLEEAARYLSTGISNLVGVFNPEIIILSGTLFDASDFFYQTVVKMTEQKIVSPLARDVLFKKRRISDNLYEAGAATMVFRDFFKD